MGQILNNLEGPAKTDLLSLSLKCRNLHISSLFANNITETWCLQNPLFLKIESCGRFWDDSSQHEQTKNNIHFIICYWIPRPQR
jgi:hypothetical protein